jgi:hypothetical protein
MEACGKKGGGGHVTAKLVRARDLRLPWGDFNREASLSPTLG